MYSSSSSHSPSSSSSPSGSLSPSSSFSSASPSSSSTMMHGQHRALPTSVFRNSRTSAPTSKECTHCGTTSTPLWRKVNNNCVCNACGLYYKKHDEFPRARSRDVAADRQASAVKLATFPSPHQTQLRHMVLEAYTSPSTSSCVVPDVNSNKRAFPHTKRSTQRVAARNMMQRLPDLVSVARQDLMLSGREPVLPAPSQPLPPTGLTPAVFNSRATAHDDLDFAVAGPASCLDVSMFLSLDDDNSTNYSSPVAISSSACSSPVASAISPETSKHANNPLDVLERCSNDTSDASLSWLSALPDTIAVPSSPALSQSSRTTDLPCDDSATVLDKLSSSSPLYGFDDIMQPVRSSTLVLPAIDAADVSTMLI